MQRYIAFLRGMNLGKRRLAMAKLASHFRELGFADVETFIASGNVLFSTPRSARGALEERIAQHLHQALGYEVDTFVRTPGEVIQIASRKVFDDADAEGIRVHVGFLQRPLPNEIARKLAAIHTDVDQIAVTGTEFYWLCRTLTSQSEVWSLPEMRALRLPTFSMRNLTSIRKLIARHLETDRA